MQLSADRCPSTGSGRTEHGNHQSSASSAEHIALPPQRIPAHDIAGRAVTTDQIIKMVAVRHGAADPPGRRPDDLGIMADIAPVAGGTVFRKKPRLEIAVFLDPCADHVQMAISVARAHPEIFTLPLAAAGLVVMAESVGPGHQPRIESGILCQFIAPLQMRRANARAGLVMRAHHHILQPAFPRFRRSRHRTRRPIFGDAWRRRGPAGLFHRLFLIGNLRRNDGTGR